MNYKMMGRFIGHILLVEAVFMTVPLAISLAQKKDGSNWFCCQFWYYFGFGAALKYTV